MSTDDVCQQARDWLAKWNYPPDTTKHTADSRDLMRDLLAEISRLTDQSQFVAGMLNELIGQMVAAAGMEDHPLRENADVVLDKITADRAALDRVRRLADEWASSDDWDVPSTTYTGAADDLRAALNGEDDQ